MGLGVGNQPEKSAVRNRVRVCATAAGGRPVGPWSHARRWCLRLRTARHQPVPPFPLCLSLFPFPFLPPVSLDVVIAPLFLTLVGNWLARATIESTPTPPHHQTHSDRDSRDTHQHRTPHSPPSFPCRAGHRVVTYNAPSLPACAGPSTKVGWGRQFARHVPGCGCCMIKEPPRLWLHRHRPRAQEGSGCEAGMLGECRHSSRVLTRFRWLQVVGKCATLPTLALQLRHALFIACSTKPQHE